MGINLSKSGDKSLSLKFSGLNLRTNVLFQEQATASKFVFVVPAGAQFATASQNVSVN